MNFIIGKDIVVRAFILSCFSGIAVWILRFLPAFLINLHGLTIHVAVASIRVVFFFLIVWLVFGRLIPRSGRRTIGASIIRAMRHLVLIALMTFVNTVLLFSKCVYASITPGCASDRIFDALTNYVERMCDLLIRP